MSTKTNDKKTKGGTSKTKDSRFVWKKGDVQIYDSIEAWKKANKKKK